MAPVKVGSVGACLVRFSKPLALGSGLENLTRACPALVEVGSVGAGLVRFSKPFALGSGLENLTRAGPALVEVGSVGADPARLLSGTRATSTIG